MPSFRKTATAKVPAPGWVSAAVKCPASSVAALAPRLGTIDFWWEESRSRTLVAGIGTALTLQVGKASPGTLIDEAATALAAIRRVPGSEAWGPRAVGGFAFDPKRTGKAQWEGFSPGQMVIPELTLFTDGRRGFVVQVAPEGEAEGLLERLRERVAAAERLVRAPAPTWPKVGSPTPAGSPMQWGKAIDAIATAIEDRGLQKAVLARPIDVALDGALPLPALLDRLRTGQPDCTLFVQRLGESLFIGATPELLLWREQDRVETVALAGSIRRDAAPDRDRALARQLLESDKDGREHRFVVEEVRGALEPLSLRIKVPARPRILTLAHVHHLESPIQAHVADERRTGELLDALHPTPATCGRPTEQAKTLLQKLEGFDRGWYAGPIGWVAGPHEAAFSVAIRSMLTTPTGARIFVGAGIVDGSVAEDEWRETELKSQAMWRALGGGAQP